MPDRSDPPDLQYLTVHGYRRAFVKTGSGPVLLLLHGLACDHHTWDRVIGPLSQRYTVVAPDFLGHGQSDKPRADYTLGGYANGMRDLLTILGIDKVTVVGHSFGGGVAMQFAYQFPERTERLVLVAPGGLGRDVAYALRAATLPGFNQAVGVLSRPPLRQLTRATLRTLAGSGFSRTRDLNEVADILQGWRDPAARRASQHVVRAVVDLHGQVVTMRDRAYLTQEMPMAVIWGADDRVIPVTHTEIVARVAPGATVSVIDDAGHFPHKDHPERFVEVLDDFIRNTQPAVYRRSKWRRLLIDGAPPGAGRWARPDDRGTSPDVVAIG